MSAPEAVPNMPVRKNTMQKHVEFFDRNNDGYITVTETYTGFRALGFNMLVSVIGAVLIHICVGWVTSDSWLPTLTVKISNIHKAKHGSDSQIYDHEGNIDEHRFDVWWNKYDTNKDGALSWGEWMRATDEQRDAFDVFGRIASKLEWLFSWMLLQEHGKMSKEKVHGLFDGSVFYTIQEQQIAKRASMRPGASACVHHGAQGAAASTLAERKSHPSTAMKMSATTGRTAGKLH